MSKKREHENDGQTTESKGKKKLKSDNISNLEQKRGWESWSREEMENFFSCFAQSGKDFDKITGSVGTKNYDQVRYFYYRVLNKVVKLLKPQKIDKKDPREVQQALLAFWDLKKTIKEKEEEYTKSFASQLRSKFMEKSQQENFDKPVVEDSLEDSPSFFKSNSLLNDPSIIQETQESPKLSEKLTIQLMPRTKQITDVMIKAKQNPRLQLTLKGGKTIAFILEYLHSKWTTTTIDGQQLCLANGPIKLYPSQESLQSTFSTQFTGWGEEEGQTTVLQLYQLLSENPDEVLKLEYDWQSSTTGQLDSSSGFTKHSSSTAFSNLEEAANVNLDNEIPPPPTSANSHSNHLSRTVTTPTKKTISENSSMWADDLSTDGFGTTLNDTDEKACKDFYKIFENSIQEGFDAVENGKGSHSSPSVSGFTWKKVLKLE